MYGARCMGVSLWAYAGRPPESAAIRRAFGLDGCRFTYFVATTAQEAERGDLQPAGQRDEGRFHGYALVFAAAVRALMGGAAGLSRSEERILTGRALAQVASSELDELRLRHDVAAWAEALADFDARGIDLATEGARLTWAHPALGDLLAKLREARTNAALTDYQGAVEGFEATARRWALDGPDLGDVVVFEGFTFLTPLQELVIETAAGAGAEVVVLFPYDDTERFEAVRATYERWWGDGPAVFASEPRPLPTVEVEAYEHAHQEAAACVQRLAELLAAGYEPSDVAVVAPFRSGFDTVLQEEAELQELPVRIGVPPRLLLLTPVGRFVLDLFGVWQGDGLHMTADQFEVLLASGWLGAATQESASEFRLVKEQLFAHVRTADAWRQALSLVRPRTSAAAVERGSRLPGDWLTDDDVQRWREALAAVERIASRLFRTAPMAVGEHVRRLLDELAALPEAQRFESEQRILERLTAALEEAADARSLDVTSREFGDLLVALAREREEAAQVEEAVHAAPDKFVWVTTPEGIDGVERAVVLAIGLSDEAVPRPYQEPWPEGGDRRDQHVARERYQFHAVERAATERLVLSYSRRGRRGPVGPSPFLLRFGDPPAPATVPMAPPAAPEGRPVLPARRARYLLSELAHFGLCPYRYKVERLDPRARRYRSGFHLKLLAQGRWLERIYEWAAADARPLDQERLLSELRGGLAATEAEVQAEFPALRPLVWREVRARVDRQLAWRSGTWRGFRMKFAATKPGRYEVVRDGRAVVVTAESPMAQWHGKVPDPAPDAMALEEWTYPADNDDTSPVPVDIDGTVGFASRYAAFRWWLDGLKHATKHAALDPADLNPRAAPIRTGYATHQATVARLVAAIEEGEFPKRPGTHCHFCPAQDECLGLRP